MIHCSKRFAAESLAYLNEPAGTEVLGQTAIAMPQFRAYALAALASMDQPAAHVKLRKLMDETDIEVRRSMRFAPWTRTIRRWDESACSTFLGPKRSSETSPPIPWPSP